MEAVLAGTLSAKGGKMCKKLRNAAQELIRLWDNEGALTEIFDAINALRGTVAEDREKAIRARGEE